MNLNWQLILGPAYDFSVLLDYGFAQSMIAARPPLSAQQRMNELGKQALQKRGVRWPDPYTFHENSALINQFYIGGNGVWLAASRADIDALQTRDNPLLYSSHNVDCSKDAFALLTLVDLWAAYADQLTTSQTSTD